MTNSFQKRVASTSAPSQAEVSTWAVLGWATATATFALWPFPYLGLLSLPLLPLAAICWTRLIILSRRAGIAARWIPLAAIATLVSVVLLFRWLADWWPTRT